MSTTENTPTEPDMATIWKIATPEDIAAWDSAGRILRSIASPTSAKNILATFFTTEEPAGRKPPDDGSVLIHYLPDGCSHVFSAEPIPVSFVSERHPMPLVDGAHVFPETL